MYRTYFCLVIDGRVVARVDTTGWKGALADAVEMFRGMQFPDLTSDSYPLSTQFKLVTQTEMGD